MAMVYWANQPERGSIKNKYWRWNTPISASGVGMLVVSGVVAALASVTAQVWYTAVVRIPPSSPSVFDIYATRPLGWIAIAIFSVFVGPGLEELTFRGRLQPSLVEAMDKRIGLCSCALVFAAIHGSIAAAPFHFMMGLAYGAAAYYSGSLLLSWTMNAAVNAASFALTQYFGDAMSPSELPQRLGVAPSIFHAIALIAVWLLVTIIGCQRPPQTVSVST